MADAPAPIPGGAGADPVGDHTAQLQNLVQQLLSRSISPQPGGMGQQPTAKATPDQTKQQPFIMDAAQNKKQDIGFALSNMGTILHNMSAKHKQKQQQDALADWQGFDHALSQAQLAAGDSSDPKYKEKVQQALSEMPFVKAMLDPSNPKSVKRLKNMHKALNPDIFDDKENVYGAALKTHLKGKEAQGQMEQRKQQMEQLKQQTIQNRMKELMQQSKMLPPDPKNIEAAARIIESQIGHEEALEFRKQAHLDSINIAKQGLDLRRDQLEQNMNARKNTLDETADYHQKMIDLEKQRVQLEIERARTEGNVAGLVEQIEKGASLTLFSPKERAGIADAYSKLDKRMPTPIAPQEQKILDDGLVQISKIKAWRNTLQDVAKGPDGQLSNQPLSAFGDRMSYFLGRATGGAVGGKDINSRIISDFSREGWAAIAGLVPGVRAQSVLKHMREHTPDPWKDSPRLMAIKLEALEENYSIARAVVLQSHGLTHDPVTNNLLSDDIKSFEAHLKASDDDLAREKTSKYDKYKVAK